MGVIIPITRNFTMLKVTISQEKRRKTTYKRERKHEKKGSYKKIIFEYIFLFSYQFLMVQNVIFFLFSCLSFLLSKY